MNGMIELKDILYIATAVLLLLGGLISLIGVKFQQENKTNLLEQRVAGLEKENAALKGDIKEIKSRQDDHEEKISKKLDDIGDRITELTIAIKKA